MNREFDPVRESEAEFADFLQQLLDVGIKLSGGDKAVINTLTERFFIAQAKLWMSKELDKRDPSISEASFLKQVVRDCVAGSYKSVYALEVMTDATVEMLRSRNVDTSTREGVIFSSSEHSGERSLPSPAKREDSEIESLRRKVAELTQAQERRGGATPSSRGRSGSGNARRRLDTPNSQSLFDGASSAGRGMHPPGSYADFDRAVSPVVAMTPSRAQALVDLKDELAKTELRDRQQPSRSLAGDVTPGGNGQDIAMSMITGLKEGFDSLKLAFAGSQKETFTSMIKFSANGKFPVLDADDKDIESYKKEFHHMSRISNKGKGMNPIEEITILKTCLRGCRLDYFNMVYDDSDSKGLLRDNPQLVLDMIWAKLDSLRDGHRGPNEVGSHMG